MRVFFYILFIIIFLIHSSIDINAKINRKHRKVSSKSKFSLVEDSVLHKGLNYQKYIYSIGRSTIQCNVLKIDLKDSNVDVDILKAGNNISVNSKIRELLNYQDSIDNKESIAAINGNFWKAYTNYPIGALFRDGKAVEIKPYKDWSSLFISNRNIPYIDNFKLSCQLSMPNGNRIYVSEFNKRRDSNSIVLYNSFVGDIVPYIKDKDIDQMYNQLLFEQAFLETYNDSTELKIDYEALKQALIEKHRSELFEAKLRKIKLRLIDNQAINKPFRGIVTILDTGAIGLAKEEIIISFGILYPDFSFPKIGDTLRVDISTNNNNSIIFKDGITGTPRLVRNGIAKHEAYIEGSKSKRFINSRLPRTAVGYDKSKSHLFLVTISGRNRLANSHGANLQELASIMQKVGCWDAMNLDGGGSTMMVINNNNIENPEITDLMRKINTVIAVRVKK